MSNFNYKDEDLEVKNGTVVWINPEYGGPLDMPEGTVNVDEMALIEAPASNVSIPSTFTDFEPIKDMIRGIGIGALTINTKIVTKELFAGVPLVGVSFEENVQAVEEGAFMQCDELKTIGFFHEGPMISKHAFLDCPKLKDVYVESALNMQMGAFENCTNVKINLNLGVDKVFLPLWAAGDKKFEANFGTVEFRQFL